MSFRCPCCADCLEQDLSNQVKRLFEIDYWHVLFTKDRPLLDQLRMFRLLVVMGIFPPIDRLALLASQCTDGDLSSIAVLLDSMIYLASSSSNAESAEVAIGTLVNIFEQQQEAITKGCECLQSVAKVNAQNVIAHGLTAYLLFASFEQDALRKIGLLDDRKLPDSSIPANHFTLSDRVLDCVKAFAASSNDTLRLLARAWLYVLLVRLSGDFFADAKRCNRLYRILASMQVRSSKNTDESCYR